MFYFFAAKSIYISQLHEAPMATQLGSSVSKDQIDIIPHNINNVVTITHNNKHQMHREETKLEKNTIPRLNSNVDIAFGRNIERSLDIRERNETHASKTMFSTKMQKLKRAQFDTKIIFIAIFGLLCIEISGTQAEKSFGLKASPFPPPRLMRNKRDSSIDSSAGM